MSLHARSSWSNIPLHPFFTSMHSPYAYRPPRRQVRRMLGPRASMFLAGVLMVYLFGSCVAYLIIFGDCLHPLVLGALGDHWFTHRNAVLPFFSAVLMFPLCLPRTLDAIVGGRWNGSLLGMALVTWSGP